MNNKILVGGMVGFALLIGFAAGRFMAPDNMVREREPGDKSAGKTKLATTKRTSTYRVPHAMAADASASETPPANTNQYGRGRGNFDPAAYAAMVKERAVTERTAFITNAGLTPAQQQDFDDLVNAMNSSLKQRAEKLAAMMKDGRPASPEAGYHMLHEYASSMMRTYDMMDRTMPPDWREKAGNNFDLRTFVDPAIRQATRGFRGPGGGGGGPGGPGGNGGGGGGTPPPQ